MTLLQPTPPHSVTTNFSSELTRLFVAPRLAGEALADTDETERLALATHVPTLFVQDPTRILAWLRGSRALRVLCAHDLTTTADNALRFIQQLNRLGRCEVTVAHVHRSVDQVSRSGYTGVGSRREHDLELRRELQHKLEERTRQFLADSKVAPRVSPAPFQRDDFILELIRETDVDVVVTPLHPPGAPSSGRKTTTSRTLLRFATTNLVVVPAMLAPASTPNKAIERVLIVTELTSADCRAVAESGSLLRSGGTLRLLHIMKPPTRRVEEETGGEGARKRERAYARLVEIHRSRLHELGLEIMKAAGPTVETEVVQHRNRAIAIVQASQRFDADVVCLVLGERRAFRTRLFRGEIRSILAKTDRPLLVVHSPCE